MTERPRSLQAAGPLCVEPMPPALIAQAAPARAISTSCQRPRGLRHPPETIDSGTSTDGIRPTSTRRAETLYQNLPSRAAVVNVSGTTTRHVCRLSVAYSFEVAR